MKAVILAALVLVSGVAFGRDYRGDNYDRRGGYDRSDRYDRSHRYNRHDRFERRDRYNRYDRGYRQRPRVYVQPQYRPYPRYQYRAFPPVGSIVWQLPFGAATQMINGQTWARIGPTWLMWDGFRGGWVVVR